ncbi:DUF5666 domain-containing protein [Roseibium sp. MMSF_3544]|uniref:DUF5666 domain-containing protein n=1 Tax=unclassified Roseibium TaxID=2629323 RepID=UPI00273FC3B6|nr:DUF5666 domain-containing protein [Roseibium sp. MMSF_3544]
MLVRLIAAAAIFFNISQTLAQDSEEREGGVVGTGIAGVITDLGSIYVNGHKIEIADGMNVSGSVPEIAAGELRPGHTVAVVARLQDDIWRAEHIRQVLPLVGPVERISGGSLTVLGTDVTLGTLSVAVNEGDWVAVSGLWQGARVLATAVEVLPGWQGPAQVSGSFFEAATGEPQKIGGTDLQGIIPRHLSPGDFVRVVGTPVPGGIKAEQLETGLFDAKVGVIQVEGYFSEPKPDGLYTVLGSGLIAFTDTPAMIDASVRIIQCGANGRLGAFPAGMQSAEDIETIRARLGCF